MPRIRARSPLIKNNFSNLKRHEQNLISNLLRDMVNKTTTIIPEDQKDQTFYCLKRNIGRVAEIASDYGEEARIAVRTMRSALYRAIDKYGITDHANLKDSFSTFYRDFRENKPSLDNLGNRIEVALQPYRN